MFSVFVHAETVQPFYSCTEVGTASFSSNWGVVTGVHNPNIRPKVIDHSKATAKTSYSKRNSVALMTQSPVSAPSLPTSSQPTVPGNRAVVRWGVAYAPANAPESVKRAIWAVNTIRTKPYVWGGGHDSFFASGYDCSGTVSFALHYAGALSSPTDSHSLQSYGESGRGRWITVYAGRGHTWMDIAGLRLDTTGNGNEGPRWRTTGRSPWGYTVRHPAGL